APERSCLCPGSSPSIARPPGRLRSARLVRFSAARRGRAPIPVPRRAVPGKSRGLSGTVAAASSSAHRRPAAQDRLSHLETGAVFFGRTPLLPLPCPDAETEPLLHEHLHEAHGHPVFGEAFS